MKTRHPVEGYFGSEFRRSVIIALLWWPEVARYGNLLRNLCVFWQNDPLRWNFQNSVPKFFTALPRSTLLCSYFVKCCGRWKLVKSCSVIYRTKKTEKQNFACLSNAGYYTDRAQNLPERTPNNILRVLHVSSKSVHFRRSYNRTREHRQIVL